MISSTEPRDIRRMAIAPSVLPAERARRAAGEIAWIAGAIALVALLAKVSLQVGPVPISGQTLGVVLVGAALGSRRGATAMICYLLIGLAGVPLFAGPTAGIAYVLSPSFGFIIGFIPAAWLIGLLAERGWDRHPGTALLAFLAGSVVPFLVGVPYMAVVITALQGSTPSLDEVLAWGVIPFIPGGIVKAAIAALILPAAWRLRSRLGGFPTVANSRNGDRE